MNKLILLAILPALLLASCSYEQLVQIKPVVIASTETLQPGAGPSVLAVPTATAAGMLAIVIADETVYRRPDPSTAHAPLGVLRNGARVIVLECRHGWSRVGEGGWVNSKYIKGGCP